MANNIKTALRLMPSVLLLILLISAADTARESCISALLLCGRLIIPSLFPFFVLSGLLTRLGLPGVLGRMLAPLISRIYRVSPAGASALPMGLIGGYPTGAAYIAQMEQDGSITAKEGERLLAFCNNSGPAFIVGVMGSGIFGSVRTGLTLYAVHVFSALVTGLFFRGKSYRKNIAPHRLDDVKSSEALVDSIKQAVASIINVCGFVICFSVLTELLNTGGFFAAMCSGISGVLRIDEHYINAFFTGILELGNAAAAMQGIAPSPAALALGAGMLGWGGLSVHFQTLAVLSKSKIKGTLHLAGHLLSAIIAAATMLLISMI